MVLKNLSTLVLAISETKKMFIMNIENGSLICELSSEKELICSDMKEISYSGKNFQIFCKGNFIKHKKLLIENTITQVRIFKQRKMKVRY